MSEWQSSERVRRLAARRGIDMTTLGISLPQGEGSLLDAVVRARFDLSTQAYAKLHRYLVIYPASIKEHPNQRDRRFVDSVAEFNRRFPTLRAFQEGLRMNDPHILGMRMVGPKILAEYRRVFLGESMPA
jgi:hypothetical protein